LLLLVVPLLYACTPFRVLAPNVIHGRVAHTL